MNSISTFKQWEAGGSPEERLDRREEVLRQEMNSIADRGHKHFQWAVTLLLTLETALFFVRKEAAERAGFAPGESFPLHRHLWGTIMMALITFILIVIARAIYSSYEHYFDQLPPTLSSGVNRVPRRRVKSLIWLTLLLFPLFDLFIGVANRYSPLQHDPSYVPPAGSVATTKSVTSENGSTGGRAAPIQSPPVNGSGIAIATDTTTH